MRRRVAAYRVDYRLGTDGPRRLGPGLEGDGVVFGSRRDGLGTRGGWLGRRGVLRLGRLGVRRGVLGVRRGAEDEGIMATGLAIPSIQFTGNNGCYSNVFSTLPSVVDRLPELSHPCAEVRQSSASSVEDASSATPTGAVDAWFR